MGAGNILEEQVRAGRNLSRGPDYGWEVFGFNPWIIGLFLVLLVVAVFVSLWAYKKKKGNCVTLKQDLWKAPAAILGFLSFFWAFREPGLFFMAGIQIGIIIGLFLTPARNQSNE